MDLVIESRERGRATSRIYTHTHTHTRERGEKLGVYILDDTSSGRDLVEFRYRGPVTPDNSNLLIMPPQPGFNLTLGVPVNISRGYILPLT